MSCVVTSYLVNVSPPFQGIFVLGLPFALARSGYVGLVLLVASACVCNHTGRVLVSCLYEEQRRYERFHFFVLFMFCLYIGDRVSLSGDLSAVSKVRVRHSYQDVVEACCRGLWSAGPGLGGWLVNGAQVTTTKTKSEIMSYNRLSTSDLLSSRWWSC